ncbi:glycosyltransferase [Wenjunlia tyrosinilytica]|uniref:Integral membrane regulatory protein n=1 Tax=Wenjunlia tyrosinilytica TaxID=1544741 RepID=A0A918DY14_9ACTN|nr:glycosyltransferase [Wenjunlia tyrosinilytica]GGO88080.1 integral membrane regulatory protein [Wenjunlia tyrosinilytica]
MSVHSHQTAQPHQAQHHPHSGTPEFPRHVVTAVIVAHDGARWLPRALSGLHGQDRPVQNVVAADTGSADESANLLEDSLGKDRVLHLARRTGFGAAVDEAARLAGPVDTESLPYLARRSGWDPVTRSWRDDDPSFDQELPEPVQWLWLLHDDCEPTPDALAQLLRVADSSPSAAVVGPKLRSWYDRRQLLEAGVSIAHSGRRWTGLDRKEQDQGQHDQVRQVLSVSSAGMLVRRDVWEELGGFDRRLPLMRDDVDFCWRVQAAGHRVLVAPDAVLRHAEAAARERRPIDCAVNRPHRVDKAGAAYTLLTNSRGRVLPYVLLRLVVGTLLRTFAYLVGKVPGQALDEMAGLTGVLLRPGRILSGRRRRKAAGRVDAAELRPLFPPPGATVRLTAEQIVAGLGGGRSDAEASAGRHGAVESGPGDEDADFLEVENFARLKRIARKPAPVLFAALLLVSLLANRQLLGGGSLSGGAMLPASAGASDLWALIGDSWHAVGTGGTSSAPPYLAVLAVLATLLLGKAGLAVTLLLIGSVPLAGLTAYFASRPLVASRVLRAWASVAYALLPAITGALAAGRIGTAVLAVLLPLMARAGVAASGLRLGRAAVERGARPSRRGLWALALLLTVTTAFTPIVWPIAAVLAVAAVVARVLAKQAQLVVPLLLRAAALLATPLLLLAPWSLGLLSSPSRFLLEAGLPYSGGAAAGASDLILLNPGGPGVLSGTFLVGILLAGLAALLRPERRTAVLAAWGVALTGLLFALPMNTTDVTPSPGLAAGPAWPGPAVLLYSLALLTASAVGAEGIRTRVAGLSFGWRQPAAVLIGLAAAAAPLFAAGAWLLRGAGDPLERRDPVQVPAFVAEESSTRDQARTLVLSGGSRSDISFVLVRGSGARLGEAEIAARDGVDRRLGEVVNNLLAGSGADQAGRLSSYAVRYVLVQDGPAQHELSTVLDSTPGILRVSQENGTALWRVDRTVARVTVQEKDSAQPVAVASGPVETHTSIPAGAAGRVLRIADATDSGWRATLNGRALTPTTLDGWAQGFELPAEGGALDVVHDTPVTHAAWLWAQGFLALVVLVLALPGRRAEAEVEDEEAAAEAAPAPVAADLAASGDGRRARRLRAQAAAEAAEAPRRAGAFEPSQVPEPTGAPDLPEPAFPGPDFPDIPAQPAPVGAQGRGNPADAPEQAAEWDAFAPNPPSRTQAAPVYVPEQYPYDDYPPQPHAPGQYPPDQYAQGGYPAGQYGGEQYQQGDTARGDTAQGDTAQGGFGQDGFGQDGFGQDAQQGGFAQGPYADADQPPAAPYTAPGDYGGQYQQPYAPEGYPDPGQYTDPYGYGGQYPDPDPATGYGQQGDPNEHGESERRDGSEQ